MSSSLARQLAERYRTLCAAGMAALDAERRAFAETLAAADVSDADPSLYEAFVRAASPQVRRAHGVYYTPPAVVGAQVRLVDDLLRTRLGCEAGLGDERVWVVDPAVGSGAYPLAIVRQAGDVRRRMRLFEVRPGAAAVARALGLPVEERDALETALLLDDVPIVVCLGNPPYRRGTSNAAARASLKGFATDGSGLHLKNLYNDYVYFWRWVLRVGFESRSGPAIVCLVTAASYLRGPAFAGLRHNLRRELDELWLIDLEGDYLAARATHNVFPIRTPVAIALGVRYGASAPEVPARVRYWRLDGPRVTKLATLDTTRSVAQLAWSIAPQGWAETFTPPRASQYSRWPALTDLFPWQLSGAQIKRTWPIGTTPEVLRRRWQHLLEMPPEGRARAFGPTRDRDLDSHPPDLLEADKRLVPLREVAPGSPCLEPIRYAYRSFDRQWLLPDARLGDFMRPRLWRVLGPKQVFLTSLLTNVLGRGPAAVATAHVPDLDHFRGSFGARAVIPLWCDAAGTRPNVERLWLERLSAQYGCEVGAQELMAYCYALLGTRGYVERFQDELRTPGPRIPLASDAKLFVKAAALGSDLLKLHTYRDVRSGATRCVRPIGDRSPVRFAYDATNHILILGDGCLEPIAPEVWAYAVSGYRVVPGWLRQRITKRRTSPLDAITPERWTGAFTQELLELLWLIEATLRLESTLDTLLDEIVSSSDGHRWIGTAQQQVGNGLRSQRPREDEALALMASELPEPLPL